ncbi:membrane-associated tyrosine- and threonine-specific cdc2-inhibitory kinase-like [Zophobas morio]|uniref:membrane-associated tyrosine- and threonine-specific cdc2-inhibitory kinase-like n=1 Tax=Zophobas morio TaxID=2755281 RepID=UPI00308380C2
MVSPKRRRYNSEVRSCSLHLSTIPKSPHKLSTPVSRVFRALESDASGPHRIELDQIESDQELTSPFYDKSKPGTFFEQAFYDIALIGKGSFGHVFKARYKENQQWFAIKRSNKPFGGPGDRQLQMNEVNFLRTLGNHPHCVRYDRAWEENGVLYIQTELCQGGTLQKFLEENINISEDQIWHFITDLTLGLKHIHDNNIVHLDIKPANIFLSFEHDKKLNSSNSSEFFNLKIGDYGIAFDITQKSRFDYQEGDNKYMAPELLAGQFGTPADIFSLGITILEIVGDYELPSAGLNWSKLRNEWQPELPSQYSDSLKNLIAEMMRRDPLKRPTVEAILRHPCVRRALRCRCRRSSTFQAISSAYMCLAEIVRKLPVAFYCSSLFLAKSLFRLSKVVNFKRPGVFERCKLLNRDNLRVSRPFVSLNFQPESSPQTPQQSFEVSTPTCAGSHCLTPLCKNCFADFSNLNGSSCSAKSTDSSTSTFGGSTCINPKNLLKEFNNVQ